MNITHAYVDKGFVNPRRSPPELIRKFNLHEENDATGLFWQQKDQSIKVPGQLFFVPGEGVKLVLDGAFGEGPKRYESFPIINGMLSNGTNCTLFSPQGYVDQYYSNNKALVTILYSPFFVGGGCFHSEENFEINLLDVQFSHLEKWFDPPFDLISNLDSSELLMCFKPENVDVNVEWKGDSYQISTFCKRRIPLGPGDSETTFNYEYRFHIKSSKQNPASKLVEIASILRECLMFLVGTGVYTLSIAAVKDHLSLPEEQKFYHIFTGVDVPSYIRTDDSLFNTRYRSFHGQFEKTVQCWFENRERLSVVIDTYKEILLNDGASEQSVFIKIIQTLEHFHGIIFEKNKYCSKNEWEDFINWFEDNTPLPNDECQTKYISISKLVEMREIVLKRISGFNSLSLRTRLEDLFNGIKGDCLWPAIGNPDNPRDHVSKLISGIENTRHYYTHFRASLQKNILINEDLEQCTALLWGVMTFYLGYILNIPEKIIDEITFQSTRAMFVVSRYKKL